MLMSDKVELSPNAERVQDLFDKIDARLDEETEGERLNFGALVVRSAMHLQMLQLLSSGGEFEVDDDAAEAAEHAANVLQIFVDAHRTSWWQEVLDLE